MRLLSGLLPKKGGARRRRRARRSLPAWLRPALRYGLPAAAVVALGAAGAWTVRDGHLAAAGAWAAASALAVTAEAGLSVQEVYVEGRGRTPGSSILGQVGVARGAPILGFDPEAARQRIESLPWVKSAQVFRRLPDAIFVRVEERAPFALWQHDGRLMLVDDTGVVIEGAAVTGYGPLPLIVGEGAPAQARALVAMLEAEPALYGHVSAAVRVGGRRWDLRFDQGVEVRLPERDAAAALAKLAEMQRSHGLLGRAVTVVDMRIPDRLVLRLPEGVQPIPPAPAGAGQGERAT